MTIAATVRAACESENCEYDVVTHPHSSYSQQTAQNAHIPGASLAKGVGLKDERGPVLAVIPANHHVDTDKLNELLDRHLELMSEEELGKVFTDCELGAIPPTGTAYNTLTVVDTSILDQDEVWFEGGDHESLLHMSGAAFRQLMHNAGNGPISHRA